MKLRKILNEAGIMANNKYTNTLDSSDIRMHGKYKGQLVEECHNCEIQWELNFESKSWGIKNLEVYVNWARIMFNTLNEQDIELELTQDNCEFISDITFDEIILIRDVDIEIDVNGKFKVTYS